MPEITTEARQFAADLAEAKQPSNPALIVRHTRVLSLLRAVWASRRGWQDEADEAHARIAELEVVQDALIDQLRDSRARVTALKAALTGMRDGAGR